MRAAKKNLFISSFSMKSFLKQVLLFALPILVLAYPLDWFLSKNLAKTKKAMGEYSVWNDIYAGKINSDIVVSGSSRAWVHISPKILSDGLHRNAYNLGVDGHNFMLQDFRYQELLRYNKHPEYIIYSVDAFTLVKREDLYNYEQFLPYMLMNRAIYETASQYEGFDLWDYCFPLIRYSGEGAIMDLAVESALWHKEQDGQRVNGYRAMDKVWNSDLDEARKTMKALDVPIDSATVRHFDDFLKQSRKSNVKVILVYTPEYYEGQKFIGNRKEIMGIYRDMAAKYHLPFLDYSNDPLCMDQKYFYNALHMNKAGSEIFSRELVQVLEHYPDPEIAKIKR